MAALSLSFDAQKSPLMTPGTILTLDAMMMVGKSFRAANIAEPGMGLKSSVMIFTLSIVMWIDGADGIGMM